MNKPIVRFAQSPLTRSFKTCVPNYAPKKAVATTAQAKQGFAQKKKNTSASSGGVGQANITLRYSMSAPPPDLTGLPQLQPKTFRKDHVGKVTTFSKFTQAKLKSFGLPSKIEKEFSSAGGAATVVRDLTLDLAKRLENARSGSSSNATYVLSGNKGSGKSILLIQSVAYALESDWIVLYTPRATEWTNSSSHYIYDPSLKTFSQWESAQTTLSILLETNKDKLAAIKLPSTIEFTKGNSIEEGESLTSLIQLGAKDDRVAVQVFDEVMNVLEKQTQFPVLWAIDEIQTLFKPSKYRAPDYSPLEPYDLSIPRLVLDMIAGRRSFSKGAILTALSYNSPSDLPSPSLLSTLDLPSTQPITPYTPLNQYHVSHAKNLTPIPVPPCMALEEAGGLFDLYARKGWTKGAGDELFMQSFVASQGNPGEIEREVRQSFMALTS
ncbi:uncharacterized protein L203_102762 [Cryptococcus depauperatus CBS 7841]|uniref:Small ribosomal subunit protein mS29 n=1 Tax=Cryptococcus depauperatus CBS 7841 TaxID=1295531 RepID=A0A1E3HV08_9TREE|nr:mitochondrial carrier protein [Cryptococcus depauperatus CBS 7841]